MNHLFIVFALLVTTHGGQSAREDKATAAVSNQINLTLVALEDAHVSQPSLSQQLVNEMMSLAESDDQPPRADVASFADELTRALIGRRFDSAQLTAMRECIVQAMHRTGKSNLSLASRLREALADIGVDSSKVQLVVRDFIAIREAVRGPDDSPLVR